MKYFIFIWNYKLQWLLTPIIPARLPTTAFALNVFVLLYLLINFLIDKLCKELKLLLINYEF